MYRFFSVLQTPACVVIGVKSKSATVSSCVRQGTVIVSVLISLYINDISTDNEPEIRLFADGCVCYREVKENEDTVKLQNVIDWLGYWASKWNIRSQTSKCNMMQLTRKRTNTLEGTVLQSVNNIKNPGLTITEDLRWSKYVGKIVQKGKIYIPVPKA